MRTLGLTGALGVFALGCAKGDGDVFRPLTVGDKAPVYAVSTLAGDSARIQKGEPLTLVNIWATWCIPCREEFPELERLHNDYKARGLRVLAVSVDQGGDGEVRDFVTAKGATFSIGRDPSGEVQRLYQTVGVPETFLVGSDGRLKWRKIGGLTHGARDARVALDSALAQAGRGQSP
jgi:thiol-disulfide isomerase/thioredoxin